MYGREILIDHCSVLQTRHREKAETLAEILLSLREPWQSRFLSLVAKQAIEAPTRDQDSPTQKEIARWLDDQQLCRQVEMLLKAWHRP